MIESITADRRCFLGGALAALAAAGELAAGNSAILGCSRSAPVTGARSAHRSFDAIEQVAAGLLDVGYVDMGPAGGQPVILLHGWPYDIHSFVDVAPLLAKAGHRVIIPHLRGHGTTRFLSSETVRNGQQSVVALDIIALMDALGIERATLAGFDWGARTADIIAALWPERCKALVSVNGYLVNNLERNKLPLPPRIEHGWWYQFYFATNRGRDGYEANRREFARLVWTLNSPRWRFDDATFERSARSFDNPDHVDIVIHNYRWRLSLAEGEPQYDELEQRLAASPTISVPALTLDGDSDGVVPATDGSAHAARFSGPHLHRIVAGAGHNLPQEPPRAFAQAVIEIDRQRA